MATPSKAPSNKSQSQRSNAEESTSSWKDPRYAVSQTKLRLRVWEKDPNGGCCIIENCDSVRAVQCVHVCPKHLESDERIMESLDWYWKMPIGGVNFNSRFNAMPLDSSIHSLFYHGNWVLIPEQSVIDKYHDQVRDENGRWVTRREDFPDISDLTHNYRFIPIQTTTMRKIAITRQDSRPTNSDPLMPDHFTIHTYPFTTLPELSSHVHPRFAIFQAGYALRLFYDPANRVEVNTLVESFPVLDDIAQIYQAWTNRPPANAHEDATYNVSYDCADRGTDKDSIFSAATGKRSLPPAKRQKTGPVPAPMPASKQQPMASSSKDEGKQAGAGYALSETSLELHDEEAGKSEDWTKEAIQTWSKGCPLAAANHTPWSSEIWV